MFPVLGPWDPTGHFEQVPPKPFTVEKVPSGHGMGAVDPAGHTVPAGQSSQRSDDAACAVVLIVPAGQSWQVAMLVAFAVPLYVPAAHGVQLPAPLAEYVPGKQSKGAGLAAGQAVPALQVLQVLIDVAFVAPDAVPSGQFSLDVVVGQYCPGMQSSQSESFVAPLAYCVVPTGQFMGNPDPSGQ